VQNPLRHYLEKSIEKSAECFPEAPTLATSPDGTRIKTVKNDFEISAVTERFGRAEARSLAIYGEGSLRDKQTVYIHTLEGFDVTNFKGKVSELRIRDLARVAILMTSVSREINNTDPLYSL
jgi:hypothetical protein